MLTFHDVSVRIATTQILTSSSGEIPSRGITFLMGPNGVGKTTLIRCLLGLEPHSGAVYWKGERFDPRGREIFTVFDDDPFYDRLTGRQNLATLAPDCSAESSGYLPPGLLRKKVKGYSAGQRKRLSLAAALSSTAELVIMDEPTNGLDLEAQRRLGQDLRCAKRDRGFLVTGHHLDFYQDLVDHVIVMPNGTTQRLAREKGSDLASDYDRYYSNAQG